LGGASVALALGAWVPALGRYGLYRSRVVASRRTELVRLVHAVTVGAALAAAGASLLHVPLPRPALARTTALVLGALVVERSTLRVWFAWLRRRGRLLRPVAVVGTGQEALTLASAFHDEPQLGYRVVAFMGTGPVRDPRFDGTPVVPLYGKPIEELLLLGAQGAVVATTDVDAVTANRLVRKLADAGLHVELSSSLAGIDAHRLTVRPLGRFALLAVAPVARRGAY
ncbi:MAG: hypothetical protein M3394_08130, partial [Actinomycetota bacterium]|nr:hypothetical protein [Actinomycetota bacterium]